MPNDDRTAVLTSLSSSLVRPSTNCKESAILEAPSALVLEVAEVNDRMQKIRELREVLAQNYKC